MATLSQRLQPRFAYRLIKQHKKPPTGYHCKFLIPINNHRPTQALIKKLLKKSGQMTKIVSEEAPDSVIATRATRVNASERVENQRLMDGVTNREEWHDGCR